MYSICASTPENSVVVVRQDPVAALAKVDEFVELGLTEIAITTDRERPLTREQLRTLAGSLGSVAA